MKERNINNENPGGTSIKPNIAFVHIGKTAGTWLRQQLQSNFDPHEICPHLFHGQFSNPEELRKTYKFFSAHIGYNTARLVADELIVVMRKPDERIVSLYNYWKSVASDNERGGPVLAKKHSLDEMLDLKMPAVISDMQNTQVWQVAYAHDFATRKQMRENVTDAELLDRAITNLDDFAVVGLMEKMSFLVADLRDRLNLKVDEAAVRVNVTPTQTMWSSLDASVLAKIERATKLDQKLYDYVAQKRSSGS